MVWSGLPLPPLFRDYPLPQSYGLDTQSHPITPHLHGLDGEAPAHRSNGMAWSAPSSIGGVCVLG